MDKTNVCREVATRIDQALKADYSLERLPESAARRRAARQADSRLATAIAFAHHPLPDLVGAGSGRLIEELAGKQRPALTHPDVAVDRDDLASEVAIGLWLQGQVDASSLIAAAAEGDKASLTDCRAAMKAAGHPACRGETYRVDHLIAMVQAEIAAEVQDLAQTRLLEDVLQRGWLGIWQTDTCRLLLHEARHAAVRKARGQGAKGITRRYRLLARATWQAWVWSVEGAAAVEIGKRQGVSDVSAISRIRAGREAARQAYLALR